MVTFVVAIIALLLGYLLYGAFVEKSFGIDANRTTPAFSKQDGVDYIPMPLWKVFLIQFLNIAGTGPIFGAISGILFGPAAYIWIVFGCIFIGAMHDFTSGMISLRKGGASLPEIIGDELGTGVRQVMRVFTLMLMVMVVAVFVTTPASLLAILTPTNGFLGGALFWSIIIFAYYLVATLLPIDAVIGKIYPIFGVALLIMAVGVCFGIFTQDGALPEINEAYYTHHPKGLPIFPFLFITIACGAISGFHATQSPMMARCLKSEKYGRFAFYGSMITEGFVALIWAAAAIKYSNGSSETLAQTMNGNPATIVDFICKDWMGRVGGILAILGVVAAPVTTGDTALRSARLITAEIFDFAQEKIWQRLIITIPLSAIAAIFLFIDFGVVWRYFGWMNQTMSIFTLWAITVYLYRHNKRYMISFIPAVFMTIVCSIYILVAPEGLSLPPMVAYIVGVIISCVVVVAVVMGMKKRVKEVDEQPNE